MPIIDLIFTDILRKAILNKILYKELKLGNAVSFKSSYAKETCGVRGNIVRGRQIYAHSLAFCTVYSLSSKRCCIK